MRRIKAPSRKFLLNAVPCSRSVACPVLNDNRRYRIPYTYVRALPATRRTADRCVDNCANLAMGTADMRAQGARMHEEGAGERERA